MLAETDLLVKEWMQNYVSLLPEDWLSRLVAGPVPMEGGYFPWEGIPALLGSINLRVGSEVSIVGDEGTLAAPEFYGRGS